VNYYEMPFEVQADGPYFNILDFFGRLSRLSRIINVGDLQFNDPGTTKGTKYQFGRAQRFQAFYGNNLLHQAGRRSAFDGSCQASWEKLSENERLMRPAMTIIVGFLLATIAPGLSAQTKPAATPQQKPAAAQQKPAVPATKPATAASAPQKPVTQTAKPAATPARPGAQAAHPRLQRQSLLLRLRRQKPRQSLLRSPQRQFAQHRKKSREQVPKPRSQQYGAIRSNLLWLVKRRLRKADRICRQEKRDCRLARCALTAS